MPYKLGLPERWPSPPPPGTTCDAHVGVSYDRIGKPTVKRCAELATETLVGVRMPFDMFLCDEHAEAFAEKGDAIRNPNTHEYTCDCGGKCTRSSDGYLVCNECGLAQ